MPLDVEEEALFSRFAYDTPSSRPPRLGPCRSTRTARKDPPTGLPDAQLLRLSHCVACRLQWTSRKSAKQKRAHIEHCAKKNALTRETVKCLIEQALAPPCIVVDDACENATTLMDSVVPTGPLRKPRRHHVVPSVRSLPETRESILDRARDILGSAKDQAEPHLTQRFGQSALARRHPHRPTDYMGEPPLTQPFAASTLRQDASGQQ